MEWLQVDEVGDDEPEELLGVLDLGALELHVYRVEGHTAAAWLDPRGHLLAVIVAGEG